MREAECCQFNPSMSERQTERAAGHTLRGHGRAATGELKRAVSWRVAFIETRGNLWSPRHLEGRHWKHSSTSERGFNPKGEERTRSAGVARELNAERRRLTFQTSDREVGHLPS